MRGVSTASIFMEGSMEPERRRNNGSFQNRDNGTGYVMARYVNWKGERKQKCKRGFTTKKEAQEWERMFQLQNSSDLDMSFEAFTELYIRDIKNRLKENTWLTKGILSARRYFPFSAS